MKVVCQVEGAVVVRVLLSKGHWATSHRCRAPGGIKVVLVLLEERYLLLEVAGVKVMGHVKSGVERTWDAEIAAFIGV